MNDDGKEGASEQPKRSRARWLVIGLWCIVCGWLVVSLIVGIVGSLFYGDGPAVSAPATPPEPASEQVSVHSERLK